MPQDITDLKLGPEVSGASTTYDLVDLPTKAVVLQEAGLYFRDLIIEMNFENELSKLQTQIADSINVNPSKVGYLIEIVIYTYPDGNIHLPQGRLLNPIGPGTEPLDALAEYARRDQLTPGVSPSVALTNNSSYLWFTNANGSLQAQTIAPVFHKNFNLLAREEAIRRNLLANWQHSLPASHNKSIEIANYWRNVNENHIASIQNASQRNQLLALTQEMATLQNQANELYKSYKKVVERLAQQEKYYDTLATISSITSIVGNAVELENLISSASNSPVEIGSDSPLASLEITMTKTTEKITQSGVVKNELKARYTEYIKSIDALNTKISNTYSGEGFSVPPPPAELILRLD